MGPDSMKSGPEAVYDATTGQVTIRVDDVSGQTISIPVDGSLINSMSSGISNIGSVTSAPYNISNSIYVRDDVSCIKDTVGSLHEQMEHLKAENHELRGYCNFLYDDYKRLRDELEDIKGCITEQQGRVILSKDDSIFKDLLENMEDSADDATGNE